MPQITRASVRSQYSPLNAAGHLPPLHDSHEVGHVKRPEGLPSTPEDVEARFCNIAASVM